MGARARLAKSDTSIRTYSSHEIIQGDIGKNGAEEDLFSFVGDKLKENVGSILRIFYNNCNGIEINRLINQKVKEHFERKKKVCGRE